MSLNPTIISSLVSLGEILKQYCSETIDKKNKKLIDEYVYNATNYNKWFTKNNIMFCFKVWSKNLSFDKLKKWLSNYNFNNQSKTLGLVLAGNIPLVGLHDIICGLLCNYKLEIKLSSEDSHLIVFCLNYLSANNKLIENKISIKKHKIENFDKVIATGSNNTGRYFKYYFKNYPNIIRGNRNGVAVILGNETKNDLKLLCIDIFQYFGLGCRNVSFIFFPHNYDFNNLLDAINSYKSLINHNSYNNNYIYNKAMMVMQKEDIIDNGFFILNKKKSLHSPLASLNYWNYDDINEVNNFIENNNHNIQCIVSKKFKNAIYFGESQNPNISDYADNVDTIEFLLKN